MAKIEPSSAADAVKKKQLILLVAGGAVLLGLVLIGAWVAQGDKKPKSAAKDKIETISTTITPGSQVGDRDVWRAHEASKVQALSQEIQSLKQSIAQGGGALPPNASAASGAGYPAGMPQGAGFSSQPLPPPPPPPPLKPMQPIDGAQLPARSRGIAGNRAGAQDEAAALEKSTFTLEIGGGRNLAAPVAAKAASAGSAKQDDDKDERRAENYIPPGTFMRVVMLSGLDAPTGGQSQNNPHPVLFRVLDHAQLPNRAKSRMKDCVITANGFGDISSERAYIRLDRLSCVDENGGVVDEAVKGYIAGEDGKTGLRGRLVSKQGQALANAFLAGIGSGLGQAFKDSATTTSTSALGSTSSVTGGKELQAGLASGLGGAMDRLSKYYVQLAEKIFPVIEIDAGRVVDAVITKGVSIERQ